MVEQTVDDLTQEHQKLEEHEQQCHDLIGLIEDGYQDLDLTPDMETITLASLCILSDTIAHRIQVIDQHLEHGRNREFENFMKGKS